MWDVAERVGGSVGRVCRQFCQLDDGVLAIEFKCDMVADAQSLQESRVADGEGARVSRGQQNGQRQRFLVDRQDRATQQGGFRGWGCSSEPCRHCTGGDEDDDAKCQKKHQVPYRVHH